MERKRSVYPLWLVAVLIMLAAMMSCHSPKSLGKSPGKGKPAAKDSSAVKVDDSPSEFFQ